MDTVDIDSICVGRPGSKISLGLLLSGLSLQSWACQGTVLSQVFLSHYL